MLRRGAELLMAVLWAAAGCHILVFSSPIRIFLGAAFGLHGAGTLSAISSALAIARLSVALSLVAAKRAGSVHYWGAALGTAMLCGAISAYPRMRGVECGCLGVLGVRVFGIENLVVLGAMTVVHLLLLWWSAEVGRTQVGSRRA